MTEDRRPRTDDRRANMPYIIDGHNLIPKIPGLSLEAIDDEEQLIALLQEYCRVRRRQVEVYFDNAPPGQPRARNFGLVTARFVRAGRTADQAIGARLGRLGRSARNWTVVSSDHGVQSKVRAAQARVMTAEEFADELLAALEQVEPGPAAKEEGELSAEELEEWLRLFGEDEA